MTLQHSPGPWSVHTDAHGWKDIQDADERFVTAMPRGSDEMVANVRLIAAAPDMLRLLRVIASGMPELRWLSEGELRAAFEETVDLVWRLDGEHSNQSEGGQ